MQNLDLALIGNSSVGALVNADAEIVWACLPRFDSDAVFCSLLRERNAKDAFGFLAVELFGLAHSEQRYVANTPILITRLHDQEGGVIEITDFAPRFQQYGRMFCPMMFLRRIRRIAGSPRICVRIRPAYDYGRRRPSVTYGSNHIRYVAADFVLRVTADCSITAIVEEIPFVLQDTLWLALGQDETKGRRR